MVHRLVSVLPLIAGFLITACSSSNSGPTIPENILDNEAPTARTFPDTIDTLLSTQTAIVFRFNELLDTTGERVQDLQDGILLEVLDSVDINVSGESDTSSSSLVRRVRSVVYEEDTYLASYTDEVDNLTKERNATLLTISAGTNSRFALNTQYNLSVGPPLRDKSSIESVNPITDERDIGNFLEKIEYDFLTKDGVWSFPQTLLPSLSIVGEPKFISNEDESYIIFQASRGIPGTTSTLIGLYGLRYDNVLEVWDSNPIVLDDYPLRDNSEYDPNSEDSNDYYDSDRGDVIGFDVTVSDNKIVVAYLQPPDTGVQPRLFVRLFDGIWKSRLLLGDDDNAENLNRVQLASAETGMYVTWLNEVGSSSKKQVNLDIILFSEQREAGLISFTKTFGDLNLPNELSNVSNNTDNIKVTKLVNANTLLVSHTEIAGEARLLSFKADAGFLSFKDDIERYNLELRNCDDLEDDRKKIECKNALIEPELSWTSEELTVPGIPTQADFSLSINESSEGFVAWKQMDNSVFNVYTRRFDGNRWSTSELMEFDDRGDAGFLEVRTTNDGHAILTWSGDNGDGTFSLKARAYVFDDSLAARNFARFRLLGAALVDDVSTGFLVTDREGNANLSLLLQNNNILTYRYLDNRAENESWQEQLSTTNGSSPKNAIFSGNISRDGRMVLLWTQFTNGNFVLQSLIFKEDANN
jgi:hypothetical protein